LQASLYLTLRACENISLRISDCLEFDLTRENLISSISAYNVGSLEEMYKLHLHDFGIFLELEPDEEEQQMLEQNIQVALQSGQIYLEDAIDIRNIKNIKLANQLLKLRRQQKQAQDQEMQQANIRAQAEAQAETAERTAMAELQKNQAMAETTLQIEQGKSQFEIQKLREEAELKKTLMELEFQFNMQLAQVEANAKSEAEASRENRKDNRTKIQATQQSELINQRQNNSLPTNFESTGNDVLGQMGLDQFEPK
jgi:hypothetical protein